jgi:hypothetical protein
MFNAGINYLLSEITTLSFQNIVINELILLCYLSIGNLLLTEDLPGIGLFYYFSNIIFLVSIKSCVESL